MVWNPAGRAPTHEHRTVESARKEAERLLGENPDGRFYVLEAVGVVRMQPVTALVWDVPPMELPF